MKLLLIDDHTLFREGMRFLLQALNDQLEVDEAESCEAAIACQPASAYDLILLDLVLPGLGGLDALRAIREAYEETPVVVLSGEQTPLIVRAAIDGGAMGFIPKSSSHEILIQALRLVLAGGVYLPPHVLSTFTGRPESSSTSPAIPRSGVDTLQGLSSRQREVLCALIQGKSNKGIARELNISEHTVKVHLSAVFRALGAANRTEAVFKAAQLNFSSPT